MKPEWKNLIRTLAFLAFLFGTPYFILHSSAVHRVVLHSVGTAVGLSFEFEKSRLSLLTGNLRLSPFRLTNKKETWTLEASGLELSVSPLSLIKARLILSHVDLQDASVTLKTGAPKIGKPFEVVLREMLSRSLLLRNVSLNRASAHPLEIQLPSGKTATAANLTLSLKPSLTRHPQIALAVEEFLYEKTVLDRLVLETIFSDDRIRLVKLDLRWKEISLFVQGDLIGDREKGTLRLKGSFLPAKFLARPLLFNLESEIRTTVATIQKLEASLGSGRFDASGAVGLANRNVSLSMNIRGVPIEEVFQKMPGKILGPAKGIAHATGRIEGSLLSPRIEAKASILNFRHKKLAASRAFGGVKLNWPSLQFNAVIDASPGQASSGSVEGEVRFAPLVPGGKIKTLPQYVRLALRDAPLEEIVPGSGITGKISGRLDLKGEETSVSGQGHARVVNGSIGAIQVASLESNVAVKSNGLLTFSSSILELQGLEEILLPEKLELEVAGDLIRFWGSPSSRLSLNGDYNLAHKHLTLNPAKIRSPVGVLEISGRATESLNFRIVGPLDLSSLQTLRKVFLESSGIGQVDLALTGSLEQPSLVGKAEIQRGAAEIRRLGEPLQNVSGSLSFQGQHIETRLKGRIGDGPVTLNGTLDTEGREVRRLDLRLGGSNVPFRRDRTLRGDANCELRLFGDLPTPLLEGKIDVIEARYVKNFEIQEFVLKPLTSSVDRPDESSLLDSIRLDLDVRSTGDLEVKSNIASILLAAKLKVKGTYGEPRIEGEMSLIEGVFEYLAAEFTMTEGRLEFPSTEDAEPTLLLRGEREVPPDYLVRLQIEGRLSDLKLQFSSTPAVDRKDIVALLAFGMTQQDLERSGGAGRALGQQLAAEELARHVSGALFRGNRVNFQLQPSSSGDLSPNRLAVGGDLTDRLSFELKTDLSPETAEQTVQANYYLTDNVLLKGFRLQAAGAAPRYRFNFSFRFRMR